jgi:tetratricopeptide (TPR) repeat protein
MSTMKDVRFQKIVMGEKSVEIKRVALDRFSLIMDPYALHLYLSNQRTSPSSARAATDFAMRQIGSHGSSFDPMLDEAHEAFRAGKYASAARIFDAAFSRGKPLPKVLRAAAEAYDRAGDTAKAIERLQEAERLAQNKKPIARRIREIRRPKFVRAVLRPLERPYPVVQ